MLPALLCLVDNYRGGSRGGLFGSDEPPSETKIVFEAILVGMGLNLVR